MATVSLEAFFPDITIHVDGCPEPVMVHAVRNALIDFCEDTYAWRETLDAESVTSADLPLQLYGAQGAVVVGVTDVRVDGVSIQPTNEDMLDTMRADWRDTAGVPIVYFMTDPSTLSVYPLPNAAVSIKASVAYAPSRTATTIPDYIYQRFANVIAAGALAQLFAMPNKSWTQPELSPVWANFFASGKIDAKWRVRKSFTESTVHVSMRGHW